LPTEDSRVSILRVHRYKSASDSFVDLSFTGSVSLNTTHPFTPQLDRFDLEDLRWYHENYFSSWYVSSNATVERIKRAELKIGKEIHRALFDHADQIAEAVRQSLAGLSVEICDEESGDAVPWESITDPTTGERIALRSLSFVRSTVGAGTAENVQITQPVHRLLLVISRPDRWRDIGYWSVAYILWESLRATPGVEIDVLRPATFDSLEKYLADAKRASRRYAAVHFDGHGVVVDPFGGSSARGYLVFESTDLSNREFIDGVTIGDILKANEVPHLSMNACRSADSQTADRNLRAAPDLSTGQPSIIEEVLSAGVSSCIGMRREIYPGSAARFFRAFYPAFFGGHSAGEATNIARNLLANAPLSANTFDESISGIEDWSIPVVGEHRPVRLRLMQAADASKALDELEVPASLSKPSIVGFDHDILALELLFADRKAVLICGPVLVGKSRLAVEYARWYSATSIDPCPIFYIRLSPTSDAGSVLQAPGHCAGHRFVTAADCAAHLRASGGVVVLDQADRLSKDTSAVLAELLHEIGAACRIIVTSRIPELDWLPEKSLLRPGGLPRSKRVELARRWADETGSPFDLSDYYPLLFFSGGLPGVLLLLVSASCSLISKGEASGREISSWLHMSKWHEISRLSLQPWPNLLSIEDLISDLIAEIKAICDLDLRTMIPLLARFHVCVDLDCAARLVRGAVPDAVAASNYRNTIECLEAVGLLFPVDRTPDPTWWLHPLLKLVASRLPDVVEIEKDRLDKLFVETIAGTAADLLRNYRHEVHLVTDKLSLFEQNISDALQIALETNLTAEAAILVTAAGWFYRYFGDIEKMSGLLNHALPYFADGRGHVRSNLREIAMPLWDLAIWLAPDWPRNRGMRPPVYLQPPKDDFYAVGLWHRANNRHQDAATAFKRELEAPASAGRYEPGDLQIQISEMVYDAGDPQTWTDALGYAHLSFETRRSDDAIGRCASRIVEARIRLVQILNHERYRLNWDDLAARIHILPEDILQLGDVADLLRQAEAERGGMSAENRSQAAMIWSRIVLARGDLTSAVAYFEQGAKLMIDMQEVSIWHHFHVFSLQLLHHGWIERSYEAAVNAFQFSMYSGDFVRSTRLRQFAELLKSTYPELKNE
jgi:hypothetical protein